MLKFTNEQSREYSILVDTEVVGSGHASIKGKAKPKTKPTPRRRRHYRPFQDIARVTNWLLWRSGLERRPSPRSNGSNGLRSSNNGPNSTVFVVLLLVLAIATEVSASLIMTVNGEFYRSITSSDRKLFLTNLLWALGVVAAVGVLKAGQMVCKEMCALRWRQQLVRSTSLEYFSNRTYYRCEYDNPDQRMSQDIDRLTTAFSELLAGSVIIPGIIAYYTYQLVVLFSWVVPTACFVFFVVGSFVNWVCVGRVVPYVEKQEQLEGNFRFNLFWFRSHAESIAFYDDGAVPAEGTISGRTGDRGRAMDEFNAVVRNRTQVIKLHAPLYTCSKLFDYLGSIVSYGALGGYILYMGMDGEDASAIAEKVSKGTFATLYLINAFTGIFDMGAYATQVAGLGRRIRPMMGTTSTAAKGQAGNACARPQGKCGVTKVSANAVTVERLTCTAPGGVDAKVLFRDLSFHVQEGKPLVVVGASGTGKTSLLRVLGGLWPFDSGTISTPGRIGRGGMFFLPQRPYIRLGTLRDQLIYPHGPMDQAKLDDELIELLETVGLAHLMHFEGGLDATQNWADILSGGEQQRVGFCRMFYHEPKFGLMDESTSALDVDMERTCMEMCLARKITMISIGHRPSLVQYHDQKLTLSRDGGGDGVHWVLEQV